MGEIILIPEKKGAALTLQTLNAIKNAKRTMIIVTMAKPLIPTSSVYHVKTRFIVGDGTFCSFSGTG